MNNALLLPSERRQILRVPLIDGQVKFINTMMNDALGRDIRILESLMVPLIASYLLSSTCGTLVQGPRSSRFSSAAVPETRNPNGGTLCPLPSVVFADAEEVGRVSAFYAATFLSLFVTFSRVLFAPSVEGRHAGARLIRGGGEKKEKREREREGERKKRKIGGNFEARKRGRGKEESARGGAGFSPPIGSLATGSPTFAANRFSPRLAYFDRIRESLERRGAISWRTCRDPFAAPARRLEDRDAWNSSWLN